MAQNVFESADRRAIESRLAALQPTNLRQWGKMTAAQMMAHCSVTIETATGDRPMKQLLIGRILGRFARGGMLGEAPFKRDAPTHPDFKIRDERDFVAEKERLSRLLAKFCERGPDAAARETHGFLGRLTGDEWGRIVYKHLDHHLRQFGG